MGSFIMEKHNLCLIISIHNNSLVGHFDYSSMVNFILYEATKLIDI